MGLMGGDADADDAADDGDDNVNAGVCRDNNTVK